MNRYSWLQNLGQEMWVILLTFAILQVIQIWRCGQSCGSAGPGEPPTYTPNPRRVAVPFPTTTCSSGVFWDHFSGDQRGATSPAAGRSSGSAFHVLWSVQPLGWNLAETEPRALLGYQWGTEHWTWSSSKEQNRIRAVSAILRREPET